MQGRETEEYPHTRNSTSISMLSRAYLIPSKAVSPNEARPCEMNSCRVISYLDRMESSAIRLRSFLKASEKARTTCASDWPSQKPDAAGTPSLRFLATSAVIGDTGDMVPAYIQS